MKDKKEKKVKCGVFHLNNAKYQHLWEVKPVTLETGSEALPLVEE